MQPFDQPSNRFETHFDAVITHNVVAMRADPRGDSEQVSQTILNDMCQLLEQEGDYARIRTADDYEGWVFRRHVAPLDAGRREYIHTLSEAGEILRVVEPIADVWGEDAARLPMTKVTYGTRLIDIEGDVPEGCRAVAFFHAGSGFVPIAAVQPEHAALTFGAQEVCNQALRFLGTPYLWGGTTPFGFDCSGFVQRLYAMFGILLPRDAHIQADSPLGTRLPREAAIQAGDLVFFRGQHDPRERGITHVGMALDATQFVHAVGKEGVIVTAFADDYYASRYAYCGAWRWLAPSP